MNKSVQQAKVGKEVIKESSPAEKLEPLNQDFQKALLSRLEAFENKINSLEEENLRLSRQITLKSGINPLSYTDVEHKKALQAPTVIPSYSKKLLREMEADDRLVEGKFEFKEVTRPKEAKGSSVTFFFRKYPGKPVKRYTLVHNNNYTLPLGVAKHINGYLGGCKYNIHQFVVDEVTGENKVDAGEVVHRMGFHSTSF